MSYPERWIPPRPDVPSGGWLQVLPALPPPPSRTAVRPRTGPGIGAKIVAIVGLVTVFAGLVAGAFSGGTTRIPTPQQQAGPRYTFLKTSGGEPVRWNPCEPIHYVVNAALAPYGDPLGDVTEATDRVAEATGMTFVYDGTTTETPSVERASYQPNRYGHEWAPVLIAWVDPDRTDIPFSRNGHVALGVASPLFPKPGEFDQYVSGWVALNATDHGPGGFGTLSGIGLTIQHELGHVVGMGHTRVFGELMQNSGGGALDWGQGDLAGLEQLGRDAGCLVTPEPQRP